MSQCSDIVQQCMSEQLKSSCPVDVNKLAAQLQPSCPDKSVDEIAEMILEAVVRSKGAAVFHKNVIPM